MTQRMMRARNRLRHDTVKKKIWFKLYKSGTKWVVAGITATVLGVSIMTVDAKAEVNADSTAISVINPDTKSEPTTTLPQTATEETTSSDSVISTSSAEVSNTVSTSMSEQPTSSLADSTGNYSYTNYKISQNNDMLTASSTNANISSANTVASQDGTTDSATVLPNSSQTSSRTVTPTAFSSQQISITDSTISNEATQPIQARADTLQLNTTAITLSPTITTWDPVNTTQMTGTGTTAGNTITIYDVDRSKSALTTVAPDLSWTIDLSGIFGTGDELYAVESNTLGDLSGAVMAPQQEIATRTIRYLNNNNQSLVHNQIQTITITRTATGTYANDIMTDISYTPWVAADSFSSIINPVIDGYITASRTVPIAQFDPTVLNRTVTVYYNPVGRYIFAGNSQFLFPVTYPNHSTDATRIDVSNTTLQYLPGYVAVTNAGIQLALRDPANPALGYIAPLPLNPLANTTIVYQALPQFLGVYYQDINDPSQPVTLTTYVTSGPTGETITYSTAQTIEDFENQGYQFVSSTYPNGDVTLDNDIHVMQLFYVTFSHRTEIITPDKPGHPGEPVDPNKPDGVKWPAGSDDVSDLSKTINETITYTDDIGNVVSPTHFDHISFSQSASVDLVTGTITPSNAWTVVTKNPDGSDDTTFDAVKNPVITGYYTRTSETPSVSGLSHNSSDVAITVIYHQLSAWLPDYPGINAITYPNNPNDASTILSPSDPASPVIPYVPGMTPTGPDDSALQSKDPSDPTKGFIPPIPQNIGQPTPIIYVGNPQRAIVTYQDIQNPTTPIMIGLPDTIDGKTGEISTYRTAARIDALMAQGYLLVSDDYPSSGVTFDNLDHVDQHFTVTFTHRTATITPDFPGKPGEDVDTDNPGAKWPTGSDDISDLQKTITAIISYVDNHAVPVAPTHTDSVSFASSATVDLVTGEITPPGVWTVTTKNSDGSDDTTFDAVDSPVVIGYFTTTPNVAATTGITHDSPDKISLVIYQQLSSWIPTDPTLPVIDYVNDPNDPSGLLPTTDPKSPVIPSIPGFTPTGPDGSALSPKDPTDPTQGFVPPTPASPGQPTPITYTANDQNATVTYQDIQNPSTPIILGTPVSLIGKTGATDPYRTANQINELVAQGYVLVADNYPSGGVIYDNLDTVDQSFVVNFTHGTATITPENPGKPGEDVDPEKPGPKWPAGSDDVMALKKSISETINYVNLVGQPVAQQHQDQVSFTRDALVDLVTGAITPNPVWVAINNDTTFDQVTSPVVFGYFTTQVNVPTVTGLTANSPDVIEQIVYRELGSWITTEPGISPIQYPNDPVNPDRILTINNPQFPVVPFVPGKIAVGPDGVTLTLKNPATPTEGYIPPMPLQLGEDTIISYIINEVKTPDENTPGTVPDGGSTPGKTPGGASVPEIDLPGTNPTPEIKPGDTEIPSTKPGASDPGEPVGQLPQVTPTTNPTVQAKGIQAPNKQMPTADSTQSKLPQTDDNQSVWAHIGLLVLSVLSLFGVMSKRRKGNH